MKTGPDFIGIGLQRAGTSWLSNMLAHHPDIWMPPLKELHYFDVKDSSIADVRPRYNQHLKARMIHKFAYLFTSHQNRPELFKNNVYDCLKWDLRYFQGKMTDRWYLRLFDTVFTKQRISGEITPYYSSLSDDGIDHILDLLPDIKIILILRDPIDRARSSLIHEFIMKRKIKPGLIKEEDMMQWMKHPSFLRRSYISDIWTKWSKAVPASQFHPIIYDDISQRPDELIKDVYSFLGVDPAQNKKPLNYKKKINSNKHAFSLFDSSEDYLNQLLFKERQNYLSIIKSMREKS